MAIDDQHISPPNAVFQDAQASTMFLDRSWTWKERDSSIPSVIDEVNDNVQGWIPAASFPSEIHAELIKAERIPDPFVGFNEHEVQCKSISLTD